MTGGIYIMLEEYEWIMTPDEVAEVLRVGPNRIYKLLNENELAAFREGTIWKIPKISVINYILTKSKIAPSS